VSNHTMQRMGASYSLRHNSEVLGGWLAPLMAVVSRTPLHT
jgi:hypothetical protein